MKTSVQYSIEKNNILLPILDPGHRQILQTWITFLTFPSKSLKRKPRIYIRSPTNLYNSPISQPVDQSHDCCNSQNLPTNILYLASSSKILKKLFFDLITSLTNSIINSFQFGFGQVFLTTHHLTCFSNHKQINHTRR